MGKKIDDVVYYTKVEYEKEIKQIRQKEIEKEAVKYKKLLDDLVKDYQSERKSNYNGVQYTIGIRPL